MFAKAPDLAAGEPGKPLSHIGKLYNGSQSPTILSRYETQEHTATTIHRPKS
jgi:hypothetical protein